MRLYLLIIAAALILLSGAAYGLKETVTHHYPAFAARFPDANRQWWDAAVSHTNKYRDGIKAHGPKFIGSETVLVWLTDAYHLFSELDRLLSRLGVALLTVSLFDRNRLWVLALGVAAVWPVWSGGFHLVYTIFF